MVGFFFNSHLVYSLMLFHPSPRSCFFQPHQYKFKEIVMDVQDDRGVESRISRSKVKHRTIHIDVYCSTSSEEESVGQGSSDDSKASLPLRTLVALGSKKCKKNEIDIRKRDVQRNLNTGDETASFTYEKATETRSPRHSAFITDVTLPLSSSPPASPIRSNTSMSHGTTSTAASGATKILSPRKDSLAFIVNNESESSLPRPTTLNIVSLLSPTTRQKMQERATPTLSFRGSPLDLNQCNVDEDIPSSSLSWRGSEFDAFASQPPSDFETEGSLLRSSPARSEVFYEGDSEGTEVESNADNGVAKFWRSPQLERRKYIQKGQEDRYREAVKRRNPHLIEANENILPDIPSDVDALSKLSVFQNFSTEELEVISKSLNKRESSLSDKKSSFKSIAREESIKQLKRMASFSDSPRTSLSKSNSCKSENQDREVDQPKIRRSASLNSRSSSSIASRSSQTAIKKLDAIDDTLESESKQSTVTSPLSKSLLGIPNEFDEVSSLERRCTPLTLNNFIPAVPGLLGKRLVNVGVFRNLERFPFCSPTIPTSFHGRHQVRRQFSPRERLFVRPQMFGEVLRSHRRRSIHFGPPKNPQCSCETCLSAWPRVSIEKEVGSQENQASGSVSLRAWSMSDLGSETPSSLLLPHTSSPTLLLKTALDISALPQLGKPFRGLPSNP